MDRTVSRLRPPGETGLGVAEVARVLRSSRSAVRKAIVRGKLAADLVTDEWGQSVYRVDPAEVVRYQTEHRRGRAS